MHAHAQLLLPDNEIQSPQPDSLDQFGRDLAIHGLRMILTAPAALSPTPSAVYVVDLDDNEVIHTFDIVAERVEFNGSCLALGRTVNAQTDIQIDIYNPDTYEFIRSILIAGTNDRAYEFEMALEGTRLVVSTEWDDRFGENEGAVLVYDALTGVLEYEISPPDPKETIWFGGTVALDSNRVAITATDDSNTSFWGSRLYIYDLDDGSLITHYTIPYNDLASRTLIESVALRGDMLAFRVYTRTRSPDQVFDEVRVVNLNSPDFESNSIHPPDRVYDPTSFGHQLKFLGDYLCVSSFANFGLFDSEGRVYVYNDQLELISSLKGSQPHPASPQYFYYPDTLVDNTLYVGAVGDGIEGPVGNGTIYAFTLSHCPADLNRDGALNIADITRFIDIRPDWNDDRAFNFFDVSLYIEQYLEGCNEF